MPNATFTVNADFASVDGALAGIAKTLDAFAKGPVICCGGNASTSRIGIAFAA